jgi:8-oxo-dGTP diphosphatase
LGVSTLERHVRAAGGVVVDDEGRIVLVHRPKYDDWSLPKGKLDPGETWEQAAVREVQEETGLRCDLGDELGDEHYIDNKGRPKTVRWFRMRPLEDHGFTPDDEVDERRWLPAREAAALLTYERDRRLVNDIADRS